MCLIRSVASALPSYVMSNFLLPHSFCYELDSLLRDFRWGFPHLRSIGIFSPGHEILFAGPVIKVVWVFVA